MNLGAEVVRLFATLALKLDHFSDAFQAEGRTNRLLYIPINWTVLQDC